MGSVVNDFPVDENQLSLGIFGSEASSYNYFMLYIQNLYLFSYLAVDYLVSKIIYRYPVSLLTGLRFFSDCSRCIYIIKSSCFHIITIGITGSGHTYINIGIHWYGRGLGLCPGHAIR
jgi:hypothetical protein